MPVLNIRISKNEKELIEKVAKFEGKSLTAYIKDLVSVIEEMYIKKREKVMIQWLFQ